MEMNTRLQVEHPVTELVTGIDLVEWQVRVAAGERLPFTQEDIRLTGHAIEARVYAEDPGREFLPTGGQVRTLSEPAGPGVRVDSGLRAGTVVGSDYDPMLSKVIAHAATREQAVAGLDRALAQTSVLGVQTNIAFLRRLLADDDVRRGHLDTSLLDRIAAEYQPDDAPDAAFLAAAAHRWLARWQDADPGDLWSRPDGWRVGDRAPSRFRLSCGDRTTEVTLDRRSRKQPPRPSITAQPITWNAPPASGGIALTIDGLRRVCPAATAADTVWVHVDGETYPIRLAPEERRRTDAGQDAVAVITSPMPGSVVAVHVEDGQHASRGEPIAAVEAMKMEHVLKAPIDGVVEILVKVGDQVGVDQPLARLRAPGEGEDEDRRKRNRRRTRMSLLGELPDEYTDLAKTVRDFAVNVVAPVAAQHDAQHTFPYEVVAGMADMGLFGLPFPEEYGGMGGDYFALCLALEELGKVDQSVAITLEAGVSLGAMPVYRFGTEQQKQEWLPRLASGSALGAFGLTEAGAGSDAGGTRTTAVADGDEWVINGSKQFITNSGTDITALITATAVTDRVDGRPKISSFLIPAGTDGLIVEPAYDKVGWNASDTHPLTFTDVRIPRENLLGEPGRGYANFLRILDEGRIAIAALAVGAAQGCVDECVRYAGERQAFGRPIGSNQAIAFKIARMETRAHVARQAYYHAAALLLAGKPFKKEAAIAKLVGSEAAMDNARDATQIFGGYGFMNEFPVARHYRDSKILEIGEGTTEVQLMLIAREVGL